MKLLGKWKPGKMLAFTIRDLIDQHSIKLQGKHVHFASDSYGFSSWLLYPAGSFLKTILGHIHVSTWALTRGITNFKFGPLSFSTNSVLNVPVPTSYPADAHDTYRDSKYCISCRYRLEPKQRIKFSLY